jgi:hypothetical protein
MKMAESSDQNPYASIEANKVSQKVPCAIDTELLSLAIWQRYFAILGIAGVVISTGILFAPLALAKENDVGTLMILVQIGVPYLLFATIVFVVPSILLFKAASVAKRCTFDGQEISTLISAQRNAWRYLVLLAVMFLFVLAGVVFYYKS